MIDPKKRIEKAEKYLQKGKLEAALEEYMEILKDDPSNRIISQAAADLSFTLGRGMQAAILLSEILDRELAIGDAAKAMTVYKKLTRVAMPRADQGLQYAILVQRTDQKEAVEAYHAALRGFREAGRNEEALSALKGLVALEPSCENFGLLGDYAVEAGDVSCAVSAYLNAGGWVEQAGGNGLEWYERAHSVDVRDEHVAFAYGRALMASSAPDKAAEVLGPFVDAGGSSPELRMLYGQALFAMGRLAEAAPYFLEFFERDRRQAEQVTALIGLLIDRGQEKAALETARKMGRFLRREGQLRDYVALIKRITEEHQPGLLFLEYMAELYNGSNREHDYCETLVKLFELYFAGGNFLKAADCIDRVAEVDAYDSGNQPRLEMLRGKIDPNYFRAIASRFSWTLSGGQEKHEEPAKAPIEKESNLLEDLVLQAEIFLQYSMRSHAMEKLERIHKLFPHEEKKNEKVAGLYRDAGFTPQYAVGDQSAGTKRAGSQSLRESRTAQAESASLNNIARVAEITRNIYRQGNVKSVLFTAVNEIGRHWNASRCIAVLCSPGKPPSIALEYCEPGLKQSDIVSLVKLIGLLQPLAIAYGPLVISESATEPMLAPLKQFISTIGVDSLLALPLVEGDLHTGLLLLGQWGELREWQDADLTLLKTVAEQMVLAVSNVKLRSLVKNLSVTDEKSGLIKRASYVDVLVSEVKRASQQKSPVTVILMQLGKGTDLTRRAGEPEFKTMMREIGQLVCSHIRQNDIAVRYDSAKIAIILADTGERNAFLVVEKLRKVIAGTRVPGTEEAPSVTVGIAEAVMKTSFDAIDIVTELINRAESALEVAAKQGANSAAALPTQWEGAVAV